MSARRVWILWLGAVLAACSVLQAEASPPDEGGKKILLTFEDLPYFRPLGFWRPREVNRMILRTLQQHDIKAAGFVVEEKIDDDPSSYIVLQDWAEHGHILGNQTYSKVDLHQLTPDDFLHHVADGQKYLRRVSKLHSFDYRYLRFPQLHQGDTASKKREVARRLARGDYEIVPVTVKTSDWAFLRPYLEHDTDAPKVARLKELFLEHVASALDYSEAQSRKVFGRDVTHILQLRCTLSTAFFLEDLVEMLRKRGYRFVSLEEALSDPIFETEEDYSGPLGLTFIDRVAASQGQEFDPRHGELTRAEIERRLK